MQGLTRLETAALHAIFSETPGLKDGLAEQLARATAVQRRNTGCGFFTWISVPDDIPGVGCQRVLGYETQASIEGIPHGFGFALFTKNGRLHMLEGYVLGDGDTILLNFAEVAFQMCGAPTAK